MFSALKPRLAQSASTDTLLREIERVIIGGNVFKNLEWLQSNETSDWGDHLKSLSGTPHPVLNTIRDFVENKSVSFGTITNLLSEVANANKRPEIKSKQLVLAKVTEMLRMATLLHADIVTVGEHDSELNKGNKISVLCGDYLLARCLTDLATLREQFYVEYMSSALRDLTLGRTLEGYPSKPRKFRDVSNLETFSCEISDYRDLLGHPLSEWVLRSLLNGGSLLGKGCSSILRIANFVESTQNVAFSFGKLFALTLKASDDIDGVLQGNLANFDNLVVYIKLMAHPEFYDKIMDHKNKLKIIDHNHIAWSLIEDGSLEKSFQFKNQLITSAVECLSVFEESEAKGLMQELIKSFLTVN